MAAWIIGFLAIPVPAGAGLRELMFLAASGLDHGPAVAVAAIARLLFIAVDGPAAACSGCGRSAGPRTDRHRPPDRRPPNTAPADGALTDGSIQ